MPASALPVERASRRGLPPPVFGEHRHSTSSRRSPASGRDPRPTPRCCRAGSVVESVAWPSRLLLVVMIQQPITREQIMAVITDPRNRRRKLWTASVVLDRMGVYRRFEDQRNYRRADRLRVNKLLADLCEAGLLRVVKQRHTLHSATWTAEVAYGLPEQRES